MAALADARLRQPHSPRLRGTPKLPRAYYHALMNVFLTNRALVGERIEPGHTDSRVLSRSMGSPRDSTVVGREYLASVGAQAG